MHKIFLILQSAIVILFAFFIFDGSRVFSAEEQVKKTIFCRRYDGKITIDGKLEDWPIKDLPSSGILNKDVGSIEDGEITDDNDYSMSFYIMYDEKNIYFSAIVKDNEVITSYGDPSRIWQEDGIELWFDAKHDSATTTMTQDDDFQIGLSPRSKDRDITEKYVWRNPEPYSLIDTINVESSLIDGGYIIEASIPIAEIRGLKPENINPVGFNISGCEVDSEGIWTHIPWSGTHHSDPTQFGLLFFENKLTDVPVYICKNMSKKILVDGILNEEGWKNTESFPLVLVDGRGEPKYPTNAKMLWDKDNLYIGITCYDEDIWGNLKNRDDPLWQEEAVEIYIDYRGESKDYVEIEINPLNTVFDLYIWYPDFPPRFDFERAAKADKNFNISGQTAVKIDGTLKKRDDKDKRWTVEVKIPFNSLKDIKNLPKKGDIWRINIYRFERNKDIPDGVELSAFSPTYSTHFHIPKRFGKVIFE